MGPEPTSCPSRGGGLLPTVAVAPAEGWAAGEAPLPAPGLGRWGPSPRGSTTRAGSTCCRTATVLVAETNKQPAPARGLRSWVEKQVMRVAGAEAPSADRISLLRRRRRRRGGRDARAVLLDDLTSPFGMALVGDALFVADTDALRRFPYRRGATRIAGPGERSGGAAGEPAPTGTGPRASSRAPTGGGSTSRWVRTATTARTGSTPSGRRAAIWEIDPATGAARVHASGLRNPVGLAFEPADGRALGPW